MFIPRLPSKWWLRVLLLSAASLLIGLLLWITVIRIAAVIGVSLTARQSLLAPLALLIFLPFLLRLAFQTHSRERTPDQPASMTATPSLRIPFQKPHLAAAVLDSTEALIILLDPQGRIIRCNRACTSLTGYSTDELSGHTFWDILLPPDEREHVQAMLTRGSLTRFPFQHQQTWVNRTGQQYQVAVTTSVLMETPGRLTHLVVTGVNITEQKHAERALQCEQHLLSQIMEVNPNGIIVVDQQGQIIFANARAADLLGRSQDEILRHTYNDPVWKITDVDGTLLPDEALPFRQVMQTGRMVVGTRLALERTADQRIMLSISGAPLTNLEGKISSVVFAFTDITPTVALEQRLQQTRDTMEQQVQESSQELEQRTEELLTLSTLGEFLQRCHTTAEAFAVIARFAHRLFPEDAGVMSARRTLQPDLEPVVSWGGLTAAHAVTDPEMCWALTCGKVHLAENPDTDLFCAHTQQEPIGPHLCIPFFVQNEVCGMLHLRLTPATKHQSGTEWTRLCAAKERLGTALAEQVSLSLSNIRLREQLHQQAVRDPLTGLYNRRMMDEALNREIRRASRAGCTFGIILFDVDHFKRFNDTYGHPAGDTLLVAVSELLRMLFRAEAILCRYGGEEFLIILPEASFQDVMEQAEELRQQVLQLRVRHQEQDLPAITISLGVAAFPVHGTTSHALVQRADATLYQAKMDRSVTQALAAEKVNDIAAYTLPAFPANVRVSIPSGVDDILMKLTTVAVTVQDYLKATSPVKQRNILLKANEQIEELAWQVQMQVLDDFFGPLLNRIMERWRHILTAEGGALARVQITEPVPNPYVAGNPVHGALFVGREEIMRRLEELWRNAGQVPSVILYGHRRMGKSSILQNLGRRFGTQTTIVDFNMQRVGLVGSTGELLANLALALYDALPPPQQTTLTEPDEERFTTQNPYTTFDRFLRQLDGVRGEQRFIITLDEFELIEELIDAGMLEARLLAYWRGLIQTYPWFVMAFAGLHTLEELRHDYWHPLFGSITAIDVSFLSPEAARRLITQPAPDFNIDYDEATIAAIIALTNGQPYLVQLVGHALVTRFNRQTFEEGKERPRRFAQADVEAVITAPEFYRDGNAYFSGVWAQAEGSEPAGQLDVLRALSHALLTEADLSRVTELAPAQLRAALATLERHDVVALRTDGRYGYTVELMRRWVVDRVSFEF